MNTLTSHLLPTLIGLLVKTTVLLFAASAVGLGLRRASAATRHLAWTATLAGVLLLPILSPFMPRLNVHYAHAPVSSQPSLTSPVAAKAPQLSRSLDLYPVGSPLPSVPAEHEATAAPLAAITPPEPKAGHRTGHPLPLAETMLIASLCAWLIGSLSVLLHLAIGLRRVGRLGRQAIPLDKEPLQIAEATCHQIGLRRSVRFLQAAEKNAVAVPVTWGVVRPVVLLPMQSADWSEGCLQAALLHELAHVQRWDWPTQLLGRLTCTLYWWHPLVWWAARQAREESERACDDLVLGTGMKAADYAQRLVEVVRSMPVGAVSRTLAVAMAQPSEVTGRVQAVLARKRDRRAPSRRRVLGLVFALALGLMPVAALRLSPSATAAGQSTHLHGSADQTGVTAALPLSPQATTADAKIDGSASVTYSVGSRVTLPNGFQVSLEGVTKATREGDEWDMYGGPWWTPDGKPVAPQSGGMDGHWHWKAAMTRGWEPIIVAAKIRNPAQLHGQMWSPNRVDYSVYCQLLDARQPAQYMQTLRTGGPNPTVRVLAGPLTDGSAPEHFQGDVGAIRSPALYPPGTRACVVRYGVAAGPWRRVATRPFTLTPAFVTPDLSQSARYRTDVSLSSDERPRETYMDGRGKAHVVYFLGRDGHLPNVARRFVAVDAAGHVTPLNDFGPQRVALAFDRKSEVMKWNPRVSLSEIREFRLQTRPYHTVVFSNVLLQPAQTAGGPQSSAEAWMTNISTQQLNQAKDFRAHLKVWAQDNKALLQRMTHSQPEDLAALFQVYASLQRLPFPLWQGDPRVGHGNQDPSFGIELPSRLTLTHLQRSQDYVETKMRRDFRQFHDLALAQSVNVGRVRFTAWASGRITRSTAIDRDAAHGQPITTEETQEEIVSPFIDANGKGDTVAPTEANQAKTPQLPASAGEQNVNAIPQTRPPIGASVQDSDPAALTFKGHPVVVLDPGHGGQDTGAVGAGGVTEKSLNLEIAQQLRAELERRGAVVYLTRDGDNFLPVMERPQEAAQDHAGYFISLHCDMWNGRPEQVRQHAQGTGTIVYYHGQDPEQHRLAQSIGLMIGQATDLTPNTVASDSTRFPTGFYVLREAHMPAVLIECGYMNNSQELARLRNPREQQRLAQRIAAGLATVQARN